jgi:hypothetical protein
MGRNRSGIQPKFVISYLKKKQNIIIQLILPLITKLYSFSLKASIKFFLNPLINFLVKNQLAQILCYPYFLA